MGCFIVAVYQFGFYGKWIIKSVGAYFFCNDMFAGCDMIEQCSDHRQFNHKFIHFCQLAGNQAAIQNSKRIDKHNLIE